MPRFLPVSNPQSRFVSTSLEYDDGEAPLAELEVHEDQSRSILASNDSPDVGFRWSVNPYRGCQHACSYCLSGDTLVVMADGGTRKLRDLRVGDAICGTKIEESRRRLTRTTVLAHWETRKRAHRVVLADGTELVASGEHRFLTNDGWKYVVGAEHGPLERPHLSVGARVMTMPTAMRRERELEGCVLDSTACLDVVEITDLGSSMQMFDITTGTGDFIANGVVSHNCYARPSHEYLSFGAGTDFERKIVVKPRAPELLRESFDKKSWKGELVVFSGNTDCYQPLESKMRLTRGCLEVCAEYRNPVGIITKSPVIERDVDVLQELARVASVRVTVSVPFWDPSVARAMEPIVTTPERRMKIVETLAKAGIPVGVSVSPIVPGLNDEHLGDVLERAAASGARHAFYVLLRLPGPVKEVFETALRARLPLRAEKVLRRMREAHGGKLYDSTFETRGRGHGPYAETIRLLFERTAKRHGLVADEMTQYATSFTFRRPPKSGQTSFGF